MNLADTRIPGPGPEAPARTAADPGAAGDNPAPPAGKAEEDVCRRIHSHVREWIGREIPSWQPTAAPDRASCTAGVPIPYGGVETPGQLYIRNTCDPPWSAAEMAGSSQGTVHWGLLVLHPMENGEEFEPVLSDLLRRCPRLMAWRPGTPQPGELDSLLGAAASAECRDSAVRALYVQRGTLVTAEDEWSVGEEIENDSLAQYLSVCLLALIRRTAVMEPAADGETRGTADGAGLRWAALLCGSGETSGWNADRARAQVLAYWRSALRDDIRAVEAWEGRIPEALMTVEFEACLKLATGPVEAVRSALGRLENDECSLEECLHTLARQFGRNEQKLANWRRWLGSLAALARWWPAFEHRRRYLLASLPTGVQPLDRLREELAHMASKPVRLLESDLRREFDARFERFKKAYAELYVKAHQAARQILGQAEAAQARLDSAGLRNLELLSTLPHADKGYLNRVRLIAKWLQRHRCDLPSAQILEQAPRCYCNFDPAANSCLAESAGQINSLIAAGLEHFRASLRAHKHGIIEDLQAAGADESVCRQVAALLGNGALGPIAPQTVAALSPIVERHAAAPVA